MLPLQKREKRAVNHFLSVLQPFLYQNWLNACGNLINASQAKMAGKAFKTYR